ncbi:hypothetical protein AB0D66_31740 [Streptomyces sp. NPDC048270]|uniref:hypothetical protein n=1 Tax=Streptomyces sp. NPDC048270 TaxID=3154615 RepID=UPI0034078543
MSDHAIPEPEAGDDRAQARGAAAHPAPVPQATAPPTAPLPEGGDPDEARRDADVGAESLRTLLEAAVTGRSVDEVADLVTLLRESGQLHDGADQALRAAAVSRPITDVISLAVLLAKEEEHTGPPQDPGPGQGPELHPHPQPHPEPGPRLEPADEPGQAPRAATERSAARVSYKGADEPVRKALKTDAEPGVPGRALRWPVAMTLAVSAVLYLPRSPLRLLTPTSLVTWFLLGLACVCLALAVLVTVRDRARLWSATTVTGIALVSIHALATVTDRDLWGGAVGGLVPWPTGTAMLAAGLTAVLSVMALLYRADRPQPQPPSDLSVLFRPHLEPDTSADRTPTLAHDAEPPAP